jgi:hypothetical protein
METLYGYTILADLALLAITIAVFIFAVTIYKGASELSIKKNESAAKRRKDLIDQKKNELTKKIASTDGISFAKELRAELDKLDIEVNEIDKSTSKIINMSKGLTAKYLVFLPGSILLSSIITSGIAIGISGIAQIVIWGISLLLLGISVYFLYKGICNIEFFSNSIDLSTLMERALERHTIKLSPVVKIDFWDYQLIFKQGEIKEIDVFFELEQGAIAKQTSVRFSGTEELDFPGEKPEKCDYDYLNMKNPKQFWHKIGDINPGVVKRLKIKVKAPEISGEYNMAYWIECDSWSSVEKNFMVKVV